MDGAPQNITAHTRNSGGDGGNDQAIAALFGRDIPPERFLAELLATQCRLVCADAAVFLRAGEADRLEVLAACPPPNTPGALDWVGKAEKPFRQSMREGRNVVVPEENAPAAGIQTGCHLVVLPIHAQNNVCAAAVFRVRARDQHHLRLIQARLESTPLLLRHHELRLSIETKQAATNRLHRVFAVLDAVNQTNRFQGVAMALCNAMATRLECRRVSLGFLKGRYVEVRAMSHSDAVSREMQAVQAIEAAMEECLDQDLEVVHPAAEAAPYASRAAGRLSAQQGPASILSLPLRKEGRVVAVMTFERSPEKPFTSLEEIETLRLTCDLCTPRLLELHCHDRWFGARLAAEARKGLGSILGPEHTWIKLAAGLSFVALILLATLKGEYRINAAFTLEARHQQAVVAPFESFSKEILVEPGDYVDGGRTLLGRLETAELRLKRAALLAEQLGYRKQMAAAMRDRKTAEAQIAQAQSDKVAAEIRLIDRQIEKADMVAPITGWVVSEDRKQQIGAPVETGDILFEIASIDDLRAELYVPESAIARVMPAQTGELASVGHPDQKVGFVVERINPIAEVIDNQNVFRVQARLDEYREWMRPGMEGEARIAAGQQSYLWIASHRLVDWLRLKLWI